MDEIKVYSEEILNGTLLQLWATSVRTRAISAEQIRSKGPTKHIQSIMTTAPWLELRIVNNFIPKLHKVVLNQMSQVPKNLLYENL